MQPTRTIYVYWSTCAAFFSSTHLCTRTKEHLVHACLYKMYPRVFFEQEVLRVLTELNTVEIAHIVCALITTHNFHSSSNQAILYLNITCNIMGFTKLQATDFMVIIGLFK